MIERTIKVDVLPTPEELADEWWNLTSEQQASFFNHLGKISNGFLAYQLQAISDSQNLAFEGKYAMERIGEYGEASRATAAKK